MWISDRIMRRANYVGADFEQSVHISKFCVSIMDEAARRETSPGKALFLRLPDGAANVVIKHYFDPYHLRLTKDDLWHWLQNHVLFNRDGRIVVLHDYGEPMWTAEGVDIKNILKEIK